MNDDYPLIAQSPFRVVAKRFLDYYRELERKESYIASIERTLRLHVFPYIGDIPICEIKDSDIHKVQDEAYAFTEAIKERERIMLVTRFITTYALTLSILAKDPCKDIKTSAILHIPERLLTDEECFSLLKAFEKLSLRNLYRFCYFSGLPIRECAAIKVTRYDPATKKLMIKENMDLFHHNGAVLQPVKYPREVIINPLAASCIEEEIELRKHKNLTSRAQDLLFSTAKGDIISGSSIRCCNDIIKWEAWMRDFKPLMLRDNFLLRCIKAGVDDRTLENYFGIRDKVLLLLIRNRDGHLTPYLTGFPFWRNES